MNGLLPAAWCTCTTSCGSRGLRASTCEIWPAKPGRGRVEGTLGSANVIDAMEVLYRDRIRAAIVSWRETGCEPCLGDLNGDGIVNGADAGLLLAQWGSCPTECSGDLDGDGDVDGADLGLFLSAWGPCR